MRFPCERKPVATEIYTSLGDDTVVRARFLPESDELPARASMELARADDSFEGLQWGLTFWDPAQLRQAIEALQEAERAWLAVEA
jgi:hypothetical protein